MNILVSGGGIAGILAATLLHRDGHRVTLIERAPAFSPVGAGIILAANATAALAAAGIDVAADGHLLGRMTVRGADGGWSVPLDLGAIRDRVGPVYSFHRAELHDALLRHLPPGVDRRLDTRLDRLEIGEVARATLRRGDGGEEVAGFDLVIGADGLRSAARIAAHGPAPLRYSGYGCWRGIAPDRTDDPAGPPLSEALECWGRGARVGLVPLRDRRVYLFLVLNAPPPAEPPGPAPALSDHAAAFAPFSDPCPRLIRDILPESLVYHPLQELEAPVWGAPRCWLIGDAAHAMTPNQGQGAGMAVEDALALAICLRRSPDLAAAHAAFVQMRHDRVLRVQLDSRRFGQAAQWAHPAACWLRDLAARWSPASAGLSHYLRLCAPGIGLAQQYRAG